jgi:carbonic anhydrase/acetyltransferase-like protein (isoleucine patch superfamily)
MTVHGRTLRATQREALGALGATVEDVDDLRAVRRFPCLLVSDDVYFTRPAITAFLRAVAAPRPGVPLAGGRANARAALAVSPLTERFSPAFQGPRVDGPDGTPCRAFDVYYLRGLDPDRPPEVQARVVPVPYRLRMHHARVNRHFFEPSGKFSIPVATVAFYPVRHWSALVAVNLLGMPSALLGRARVGAVLGLLARLPFRAGSLHPERLRGKLYLAGRGCRVHPSAHVEQAVLGRGVRIGPNAVVRGSVLGDKVEIGSGAVVAGCSLGRRVTVNDAVVLKGCVVGDEASVGAQFTQFSVLGRGAVLCPVSGIFDFKIRGTVMVRDGDRLVASGSRFLGGCLGHGAFLGAGALLDSGQEVPNGCVLIHDPRAIHKDIDPRLRGGSIVTDRASLSRRRPPGRLRAGTAAGPDPDRPAGGPG